MARADYEREAQRIADAEELEGFDRSMSRSDRRLCTSACSPLNTSPHKDHELSRARAGDGWLGSSDTSSRHTSSTCWAGLFHSDPTRTILHADGHLVIATRQVADSRPSMQKAAEAPLFGDRGLSSSHRVGFDQRGGRDGTIQFSASSQDSPSSRASTQQITSASLST